MAVARMIVAGLDGATFDRIKPWAAAGKLPAFARLLGEGAHAELRSASVCGRRICEIVNASGKRVDVVPTSLGGAANADDRRGFGDDGPAPQRRHSAEVLRVIDRRESDLLWVGFRGLDATPRYPAHPAPNHLGDTTLGIHQLIDECLAEILRRLDDETGLLVVSADGGSAVESHFFVTNWLAEAGFLRMKAATAATVMRPALDRTAAEVYALVRAFRRSGLGWLPKLLPRLPTARSRTKAPAGRPPATVDWSATRVYGVATPGGLRVNLRGRETEGVVAPDQFHAICAEVRTALLDLRDPADGRRVIRAVHVRDAMPAGDGEGASDLVIETTDPYCSLPGVGPASLVPAGQRQAERERGIFILAGAGARRGVALPDVDVRDVTTTLLHLLDVRVPADMDGGVLWEALAGGCVDTSEGHRSIDKQPHQGLGYQ
jgi:predicted AlkP superfamily phosphohydrolase/phosphomutase